MEDLEDRFRGGSPRQSRRRFQSPALPANEECTNKLAKLEADILQAVKSKDWIQVHHLAAALLQLEGNQSQSTIPLSTSQPDLALDALRYDRLTVFQAEPLVYLDKFSVLQPMESLNFAWEKDALVGALQEAREGGSIIELEFDIATTDRLNAFMSSPMSSPILHISCHGVRGGQLALENGVGAAHFLDHKLLKDFYVSPRDSPASLKVVFVSACHSRATGEAFINAGIPHVICCRASEERIRDSAAIEFTKSLYRALANGNTLLEAFLLAKNQVKHSPMVKEAHVEMDKFVLLPEGNDDYHNVPVFFERKFATRPRSEEASLTNHTILPPPPSSFVGRQEEAYRIIAMLRRPGIVHLVGPEGVGKGCLASIVANYINDRRKLLYLDEVSWCPPIDRNSSDPLDQAFDQLFDLLATASDILEAPQYHECRRRIVHRLGQRRTLLVVDARTLASTEVPMLSLVLQDLLNWLTSIKMLIVCQGGESVKLTTHRLDATLALEPLTFEASARLFASQCDYVSRQSEHADPIVNSVSDFVNLIFSRDTFRKSREVEDRMSKRSADLFVMLGAGSPQRIRDLAATMTPAQYAEIIKVAKKQDMVFDFINTRHKLDKAILQAKVDISHAQELGLFQKAQEHWEMVQEMERLKRIRPTELRLEQEINQLRKQSKRAVLETMYTQARKLNKRIKSLQFKLELEAEDAEAIPIEDESINKQELPPTKPRDARNEVCEVTNWVAKIFRVEDHSPGSSPSAASTPSKPLVKYRINGRQPGNSHPFTLQINRGAVQSFSCSLERTALVVASNEACTGGMGVLRAITDLGGPPLLRDVKKLPSVLDTMYGDVRCVAGDAKLVGRSDYNKLPTPYVIFAVGPWFSSENEEHSLLFLTAAYRSALELARDAKLEALAFSLIGSSCRGGTDWVETIRIGFGTIARFDGYPELKEIHVFGFSAKEANELVAASKRYDLELAEPTLPFSDQNWTSF